MVMDVNISFKFAGSAIPSIAHLITAGSNRLLPSSSRPSHVIFRLDCMSPATSARNQLTVSVSTNHARLEYLAASTTTPVTMSDEFDYSLLDTIMIPDEEILDFNFLDNPGPIGQNEVNAYDYNAAYGFDPVFDVDFNAGFQPDPFLPGLPDATTSIGQSPLADFQRLVDPAPYSPAPLINRDIILVGFAKSVMSRSQTITTWINIPAPWDTQRGFAKSVMGRSQTITTWINIPAPWDTQRGFAKSVMGRSQAVAICVTTPAPGTTQRGFAIIQIATTAILTRRTNIIIKKLPIFQVIARCVTSQLLRVLNAVSESATQPSLNNMQTLGSIAPTHVYAGLDLLDAMYSYVTLRVSTRKVKRTHALSARVIAASKLFAEETTSFSIFGAIIRWNQRKSTTSHPLLFEFDVVKS
ncbi:hypothetical protein NUW58_g9256 [Xylaria curta]|uniref:Uncharacterized protein n=1 Tax=Xylaria curta TaxID=42375 RepID=A0ACC1N0V9_9PEZI|nr:hypothetical protein NUW58_g9256 [Xylaria curta]